MGSIIPHSSLRVKQLPYPGHFQKLEILWVGDSDKARREVNPQSPRVHLDGLIGVSLPHHFLPTKRGKG